MARHPSFSTIFGSRAERNALSASLAKAMRSSASRLGKWTAVVVAFGGFLAAFSGIAEYGPPVCSVMHLCVAPQKAAVTTQQSNKVAQVAPVLPPPIKQIG